MAANFDHLLLTKFNIRTTEEYGPAARRLNREWLEKRLAEFETFSLPSVRSQSEQAFRWLVFCDDESPDWFKSQMSGYADVLEPVYVSDMKNATMGTLLRDRGYTSPDRALITTRVDNDDALSIDFIEAIQDQYQGQQFQFVNFPWGLRASQGALFTGYWRSNPFMSLIEAPSDAGNPFQCVYRIQHHLVKKQFKIHNVNRPVSWMRSMHSSNTVQTQVGLPRLSDRSGRFMIDWQRLPEGPSTARKVVISLSGYRSRLRRSKKYQALVSKLSSGATGRDA